MKIHELLSVQGAWCKGRNAANAAGDWVDISSPSAVRFCLFGAAARCYDGGAGTLGLVLAKLEREISGTRLPSGFAECARIVQDWNDHPERRIEDVLSIAYKIEEEMAT